MGLRSQDLRDTYFDISQFYYANVNTWLNKKFFQKILK